MAGYNNHRFLSVFNQNIYEEAKNKDIISEKGFELKDGEYPEVHNQITLRGWKRLTSPRKNVKMLMIKEFFANAARAQSELDDHEHHPLKSFVRGVEVDFSPANIKKVIKFKDQTQGAATDYSTRLATNQKLDEVLRELCIPEATWKLGTGRKELQPLARGWLELIIHNIQPSSNRSEVTIARAILIHSILKGEDVRVEELISAKIVNMAQNLSLKGKMGFPSLIYKLCKDAKVPFREYKGTPSVEEESPITAKLMETVRGGAVPLLRRPNQEAEEHNEGPRQEEEGHHEDDNHEEEVEIDQEGDEEMQDVEAVYHSPQPQPNVEHESETPRGMDYEAHYEQQPPQQYHPQSQPPQPPSQAILDLKVLQEQQQQGFKAMTELVADSQNEVLNYYEKIKEYQEYQYDQMKAMIAQQQEMIQTQNREYQVMKNRHDQMEKELSEIRQA
ncbi:hypothetical protein PIB30_107202 [Stylosanthes scabra]|uniref:Putative plant transposon protein domain-containing protein n=1 Tax=Stylosanthes scabra TaxID=79078 RepID=A0ABU6T0D5_9FABA|nr:hypothetical protein [Stylosanthes scabra]